MRQPMPKQARTILRQRKLAWRGDQR